MPQASVLALQAMRKGGMMRPRQKVLINGAGGGVGTFAIQFAKFVGTEVTGVDASHKLDVMCLAGADHVIDYIQEDFTRTGERYDLINHCQNFRPMADSRRALTDQGSYAMVGGSMLRALHILFLSFWPSMTRNDRKFCLVAERPNKELTDLKELVEAGKLAPVIDRVYRLSEVPEALRYFGERHHKGKIAIGLKD